MNREQAHEILMKYMEGENYITHSYAVEAIMRGLAKRLAPDAKTTLQYAILAADPMSGFVKAVAQIYPDKKIASVKHKSVMKRFNELRFAKGANRDYMEAIEFTGLSLDDLIDVALEEMGFIADKLGL